MLLLDLQVYLIWWKYEICTRTIVQKKVLCLIYSWCRQVYPKVQPCMQKGDSRSKLAVSERDTGKVHIYDVRSGNDDALHSFEVHRTPVVAMRYNAAHDIVLSVDQKGNLFVLTFDCTMYPQHCIPPGIECTVRDQHHTTEALPVNLQVRQPSSPQGGAALAGMIEYWSANGYGFPEGDVEFSTKMDTDLYALPKAKAMPQSLEISSDGSQFAIWSSDR